MKTKIHFFILLATWASLSLVQAQWTEVSKILASDIEAHDDFGCSVAIDGDYAIVGARMEDTGETNAGAAYIFKRTGTVWSEEAKIQASDITVNGSFGRSVSISGNYVVVGAENLGGGFSGAAYIFKRTGTVWSEEAKIQAGDATADDAFGSSVCLLGNYLIVGSYKKDTFTGSAYIFKRTGTTWSQEAKIQASDGQIYDRFGYSVAIDGDYVVVGAAGQDYSGAFDAGIAYIFKRTGTVWSEEAKIQASDKEAGDIFGSSVSMSVSSVIIGAPSEDAGGTHAGAGYFFEMGAGLPLDLLYFEAEKQNKQEALLTWGLASVQEGDVYILERSIDGQNFEAIYETQSQDLYQSYVDRNLLSLESDILYYRLKLLEANGMIDYSPIRSVRLKSSVPIQVYPNPVVNYLNINNLQSKEISLHIFDALGKEIYTIIKTSEKNIQLDTGSWTKGIYLIKIQGSVDIHYFKILKQ